jgi:hypothetical protein
MVPAKQQAPAMAPGCDKDARIKQYFIRFAASSGFIKSFWVQSTSFTG